MSILIPIAVTGLLWLVLRAWAGRDWRGFDDPESIREFFHQGVPFFALMGLPFWGPILVFTVWAMWG